MKKYNTSNEKAWKETLKQLEEWEEEYERRLKGIKLMINEIKNDK